MTKKESHPIRSGIFVTVIGGIILSLILSPTFQALVLNWISNLWDSIIWVWLAVFSNYAIPGWLILIVGVLSLPTLARIFRSTFRQQKSPHQTYVSDYLHGVKWRWEWFGDHVSNLWCYCPTCDAQLVYEDLTQARILDQQNKTNFICEHCGHKVVTSLPGDKEYSIALIEREIDRKIRTGEYKATLQVPS